MIDYKDIGIRIRAVRKERGMTLEQLAEAVGVVNAVKESMRRLHINAD